MKPAKNYRDLEVWNGAMDLVVMAYSLCDKLPESERFRLLNQICRAAGSVPANIAEGQGRYNRGDFRRHLLIARGSLSELETHLLIALRLGYINKKELIPAWKLAQRVGRQLNGLIKSQE